MHAAGGPACAGLPLASQPLELFAPRLVFHLIFIGLTAVVVWHHCASLLLFLLVHTVLTLILALSVALALALLVQQVLTLFQRIDDAACDLLRRALARDAELLTNALELR